MRPDDPAFRDAVHEADRPALRETFNQDAARYDRARPTYPPALIDDLVDLAGISAVTQVLEIGPGTGQLTRALAERGGPVIAVELGPELAALAADNLAQFPNVSIEVAAFEHWQPPPVPFDVVAAATAFHWLDPIDTFDKVADVLRPGGALATISTVHIAGGSRGFFRDAQDCYQRWDPNTPPGVQLAPADEIPADTGGPPLARRFEPPVFRRYEREITYTTAAYLDLLQTYSGHRALPPAARHGLLSCIARHADHHGGRITKRYLHELRVARQRTNPSTAS